MGAAAMLESSIAPTDEVGALSRPQAISICHLMSAENKELAESI